MICGKISRVTDDRAWLKQMKPVPKYVQYAARGLGVLLVQNAKEVLNVEQRWHIGRDRTRAMSTSVKAHACVSA